MDDLDALLSDLGGGSSPSPAVAAAAAPRQQQQQGGSDDLDSLLSSLSATSVAQKPTPTPASTGGDDLDSLLTSLSSTSMAPTPAPQAAAQTRVPTTIATAGAGAGVNADDLDSLLSSLSSTNTNTSAAKANVVNSSGGTDDLDSLLSSLGGGGGGSAAAPTAAPVRAPANASSGGGTDDLDALLTSLGGGAAPKPAPVAAATRAPAPAGGDDLDSLMASLSSGTSVPPAAAAANRPAAVAAAPASGGGADDLDSLMASLSVGGSTVPTSSPAPTLPSGGGIDAMLSGLQSEMGGLNTATGASRGNCSGCGGSILGEIIQAMGRAYHPEHFCCANCSEPLGTRNFFEVDGQPQCERCYSSVGCPRCAYCSKPVIDRCITALNKKWHVEHFMCTKCLNPFADGQFYERDGKPWCKPCFDGQFSYSCGRCSQPIVGDVVNALGKHWHPDHFVCTYCGCGFGGGMFFEREGKPYCKQHYQMQSQAICAGCGSGITGRVVEAFGKRYHPEHFVCGFCMNPLGGAGYTEHEGKPYCTQCSKRLF
jgi:paxillin